MYDNVNRWSPLHISARNGHLEVVKILLENPHFSKDEKKEYLEMEDQFGDKSVDIARDTGHSEIVKVNIHYFFCTPAFNTIICLFGLSDANKKNMNST